MRTILTLRGLLFVAIFAILVPHTLSAGNTKGTSFVSNARIQNGIFIPEDGNTRWYPRSSGKNIRTYAVTPTHGGKLQKTYKFDISNYSNGNAEFASQEIPITIKQDYLFSDLIKSNVSTTMAVRYRSQTGGYIYSDPIVIPANTTWSRVLFTISPPEDAVSISIFYRLSTVGHMEATSFLLVYKDSSILTPILPIVYNISNFRGGSNGSYVASVASTKNTDTETNTGSIGIGTTNTGTGTTGTRTIDTGSGTTGTGVTGTGTGTTATGTGVTGTGVTGTGTGTTATGTGTGATGTGVTGTGTGTTATGTGTGATGTGVTNTGTGTTATGTGTGATGTGVTDTGTGTGSALTGSGIPVDVVGSPFDAGMVTFSFDDGWTSQFTSAIPILDGNHIKGTFAIITNEMQNADNDTSGDHIYMNTAETLSLQATGHEIAGHTLTHTDLTTLSLSGIFDEVVKSRNTLLASGFSPVTSLIYPYGEHNAEIDQIAQNNGYNVGRDDTTGYNTRDTDKFALYVQAVGVGVTFTQIQGWIDTAYDNKLWLIIMFHQIDTTGDTYAINPTLFAQIVDYVKLKGIATVTIGEGATLMH